MMHGGMLTMTPDESDSGLEHDSRNPDSGTPGNCRWNSKLVS
jgi:hypothetical protein